jgi:hypothetical protein
MTRIARGTSTGSSTARRRSAVALTALLTGVGTGLIALAPTASADSVVTVYDGPEEQATFVVPARVTSVKVDLVGGRGGSGPETNSSGGYGATLSADLDVTPGQTLYVLVGGNGADGATGGTGGTNGGGSGGSALGGGGGGASDVRTVTSASDGSLASRVLVAGGGGGGAGAAGGSSAELGSDGAAVSCGDSGGPGGGATATRGGVAGADSPGDAGNGSQTAGSSGVGGEGGSNGMAGGGGGGGGYFGGGGGGAGFQCGGGGGGGSSYAGTGTHGVAFGTDTTGAPTITITYDSPGPEATTAPATEVTQTSATLHGVVVPAGETSTYQFEYGPSTTYGTLTDPPQKAGSGNDQVSATVVLTGLAPGTTYHFQLVATNVNGTTRGGDQSFTTADTATPAAAAPQATTSPASDVTQTGATLNGVVTPEGANTSYHFEYGISTGYGTDTASQQAGSGQFQTSSSAVLTGLEPGTTYHVQLVATNANGTTRGGDRSFTTSGAAAPTAGAPQATTSPASGVGKSEATANGVVNPEGAATTYVFEYGKTEQYGSATPATSAGSGRAAVGVQAQLTGLARHTTYHFRLVATNGQGTVPGVDLTFRTS